MTKPKTITVVHCWSSPRSRSTAFLYSFDSRSDTIAIDEPLYRKWLILKKDLGFQRPYQNELIQGIVPQNIEKSSQEEEDEEKKKWRWNRELDSLQKRIAQAVTELGEDVEHGVIFCKHMAKHAEIYDLYRECEPDSENSEEESKILDSVTVRHCHILLLRDPVSVLSSWNKSSIHHGNNLTPDEVGITHLLPIYSSLSSRRDQPKVVVLDSDEIVSDPSGTLNEVCARLDIPAPQNEEMLSWKSGRHDCDGPWADWWYDEVWNSTGWSQSSSLKRRKYHTMDVEFMSTLKASLPSYDFLRTLTMSHQNRVVVTSTLSSHLKSSTKKTIYDDDRNANIFIYVGPPDGRGRLLPRDMASVSPFDSVVQGGDGAWEGIRVYKNKIFQLEQHLKRLERSAKALGYENCHSKEEIVEAVFKTLAVNGMRDEAHMRLTLTRGEKYTSTMNPKVNIYGTTLIIIPEWKPVEGATTYDNNNGITLITSSTRRNSPSTLDSKIHHNNMINNILPKIQANLAGVADAIMLDLEGYVAETNATNLFMVHNDGVLVTPHADYCLPGITRETVLFLAKELEVETEVRRVSLAEFHSADEVFTTGSCGALTPVVKIDGRIIGEGVRGPVTERLQNAYKKLTERPGWSTDIPPFD